ncbi:MAG TPA: hypothetical protein VF174_15765 [Micromonosporaceae bacterium]
MNVYIVAVGERGEGQVPYAVVTTLRAAKQVARWDHGVQIGNELAGQPGRWMGSLNGTDEVWIYRMAVAS